MQQGETKMENIKTKLIAMEKRDQRSVMSPDGVPK